MNDWFWVALGVSIPAVIFYGLWIVYGGWVQNHMVDVVCGSL